MLEPGTILQDKYIIERVLGQGGMGTVYLGRHKVIHERLVAIKETVLPTLDLEERERVVSQFNKEAQLLARLDHPALVQVSDFFGQGDSQFLVMTYVDGKTLDIVAAETEGLPSPRRVVGWAEQIADVLTYMHAQKPPVIYRDLKPSNVMVDGNGKIWLLDFGIAREAEVGSKTATVLKGYGTPGYAPPEQFGRATTDARSDIYALGATIYALLTSERPPMSVDLMTGDARITPPATINQAISAPLERAIMKMMALRKEDRYSSMAEVREVLRAIPFDRPGDVRTRPQGYASSGGPGAFKAVPAFKGINPAAPTPLFGQRSAAGQDASAPTEPAAVAPAPLNLPQVQGQTDSASRWATPEDEHAVDENAARGVSPVWISALAVLVVCLALGTLCALGKRTTGFLFMPTIVAYPIGKAIAGVVGGILLQFALPLAAAALLMVREQRVWAYFCLFIAAQGIVWLGVGLATGGSSATALDLKTLLKLSNSAQMAKTGDALRTVGLLAMLGPAWFMLGWLWANRPGAVKPEPAM